jgi:Ulp1 family protease
VKRVQVQNLPYPWEAIFLVGEQISPDIFISFSGENNNRDDIDLVEVKKYVQKRTILPNYDIPTWQTYLENCDRDEELVGCVPLCAVDCGRFLDFLERRKWISDVIIDFYGHVLNSVARSTGSKHLILTAKLFQSAMKSGTISDWHRSVEEGITEIQLAERIRQVRMHVKGMGRLVADLFESYDGLIFPVHHNLSHWVLVHVIHGKDGKNGTMCVYDPYNVSTTQYQSLVSFVIEALKNLDDENSPHHLYKYDWVDVQLPSNSKQTDSWSCGVYVMTLMEYLIDNVAINQQNFPETKEMQSFERRKYIAEIILSRKLYYHSTHFKDI